MKKIYTEKEIRDAMEQLIELAKMREKCAKDTIEMTRGFGMEDAVDALKILLDM